MHFLLFYEKVSGYSERQIPLQASHREHVRKAAAEGTVILAGSLGDPDDGDAVLLFKADSPAIAETFAQTDPYVTGGVIARWWVRSWDIVAGSGASSR